MRNLVTSLPPRDYEKRKREEGARSTKELSRKSGNQGSRILREKTAGHRGGGRALGSNRADRLGRRKDKTKRNEGGILGRCWG